ncbi:MAG: hypothetical protein IJQ02_17275 [Oscillospiraceae bacterium]|nr:hypothetical protein [Oscillospiraceae bacterium]
MLRLWSDQALIEDKKDITDGEVGRAVNAAAKTASNASGNTVANEILGVKSSLSNESFRKIEGSFLLRLKAQTQQQSKEGENKCTTNYSNKEWH